MADTFTNDLRLRLQESGGNSGQWGDLLNTTITNLAEAFSYGSEAIANASTHTITLQDGTSDEARSMYLKCTGGGQACTVTLAPNTISKLWFIENATSYTLTFSQGSGANVAVAAGAVKVIATDGAGSGAAVYDALVDLDLTGTTAIAAADITTLKIGGTTVTSTAAELNYVDGVTSAIQTQIDAKAPLANPTFTGSFTSPGIDDNADAIAITIDSSEKVKIGSAAGSEKLSVQGSITSDGYIYPTTDNGWSLGLSTNRWGSVFAQTADFENSVGIGTSSPEYLLTLEDTTPTIALNHDTSWPAANAELGRIYFATDWNGVGAKIKGESDAQWGNSDYPGRLTFWTTPDGAADAVERMRISSGGDLILAANATGAALIKGVSGDQTDRNTGGYPQYTFVGNEGTGIRRASANVLAFDTGGAEAMRIDASGNVGIGASNPDQNLVVESVADTQIKIVSGGSDDAYLTFYNGTSLKHYFKQDNTGLFELYYYDGSSANSRIAVNTSGDVLVGTSDTTLFNNTSDGGIGLMASNRLDVARAGDVVSTFNRMSDDGSIIQFYAQGTLEGSIDVSGNNVTLVGFSGAHASSGIDVTTAKGTVVSTIDQEHKNSHAKIKVSDSEGDARVYGVIDRVSEEGDIIVSGVGIGEVKVTGACAGGDLLESAGDGTAKVQSDDIIRSKTIGKVTIGNSDQGVKLVSCVLYCG